MRSCAQICIRPDIVHRFATTVLLLAMARHTIRSSIQQTKPTILKVLDCIIFYLLERYMYRTPRAASFLNTPMPQREFFSFRTNSTHHRLINSFRAAHMAPRLFFKQMLRRLNAAVLNKEATRCVSLPNAQFIDVELLAPNALSSPLPPTPPPL